MAQLSLLPSAASIAPAAGLPPDACSLVRVSQRFPGQSARQVRAFVGESAPSNEPSVNGRFDRLQAARLYQGSSAASPLPRHRGTLTSLPPHR